MLWAVFLVYLFVLLSLGRLFALHAAGSHASLRPSLFNPATCLVGGGAVWVLWWLVLVPLCGAGTVMVMGLFVLFTLALTAAMYRTWRQRKGQDHFVTPLFLSALLLSPLLLALPGSTPAYVADYTWLTQLQQLVAVGGWPTANQAIAKHITDLSSAPGWMALVVPLAQAGLPLTVLAPLLSFVAVLVAACTLTVNVGVPIKWSNLLLATCAGVLVTTLTLALPLPLVLVQQSPVLWLALGLLVGCLPLLSPLPLPVGIAALPPALGLTLVATLHAQGIWMALWVGLLWLGRLLVEGQWHVRKPHLFALLAAHILLVLPLLGWGVATMAWAKGGGTLPTHWLGYVGQSWGPAPATPSPAVGWQLVQWAGILLAFMYATGPWWKREACGGLRGVLTTHAWRSMAMPLLGGVVVLALVTDTLPAWLPTLGWLALFVVWKRALLWYQTTIWQRRSFAMPWRLGALLALLVLIGGQATPKPQPTQAQRVVQQLRELSGEDALLAPGMPLALWVEVPEQAALLPIAGYALAPAMPVLGMQGRAATLGELHATSRAAGAAHLVVIAPTKTQRSLLKLPEEAFLALFTTTSQQVLLTALFTKNGERVNLAP